MIKCRNCGAINEDNALRCTSCGIELKSYKALFIISIIAGAAFVLLLSFGVPAILHSFDLKAVAAGDHDIVFANILLVLSIIELTISLASLIISIIFLIKGLRLRKKYEDTKNEHK